MSPQPRTYGMRKGSQQGGTIRGTVLEATLNRFLTLGSVVVGAHLKGGGNLLSVAADMLPL